MALLDKKAKIGNGIYGIVYLGESIIKRDNDDNKVAVKRNLADLTATGVWSVREMNMMMRLRGHPFIVNFITPVFEDPFLAERPMSPIDENKLRMKEDKVHFIMEYVETSCDKFLRSEIHPDPSAIKIMILQLLLGTEYMHSQNVTHRDIKPANLLLSNKPGEGYRLRICDFGLSQVLCRTVPTPGVVTSWYRAPEICCEWSTYGKISDMWSIGCTIFEFCSLFPYLNKVEDTSAAVFSTILSLASKPPSESLVKYMFDKGKRLDISHMAMPYRRKTLKQHMNLSENYLSRWNSTTGSMDQLTDLLEHLLCINPDDRWTATQALQHPFFNSYKEYITAIRERHSPQLAPLPVISIIKCIERTWMIRFAFSIYNSHMTDARINRWYKHRIIFHAIDLFDQYLKWAFTVGNCAIRASETKMVGRLLTERETHLKFYVCLYLMYKFYSTLTYPLEWSTFCPSDFHSEDQCVLAEEFELIMIKDVTCYSLYRDTLLEISDQYGHPLNEDFIRTLLIGFGEVREWSGKSVRALYRKLMNLNEQGQPILQTYTSQPIPMQLPVAQQGQPVFHY